MKNAHQSTESLDPTDPVPGGLAEAGAAEADGYEIVRQLLERQDAVLEQLSELENRVQQTVQRFIGKTDSGEDDPQAVPQAA